LVTTEGIQVQDDASMKAMLHRIVAMLHRIVAMLHRIVAMLTRMAMKFDGVAEPGAA
jgi:hypothetical protein